MKISIIIPTYNSLPELVCAIESVKNQDYGNIELIIIDGESTDGTINIINKYFKQGIVSKWISEKDSGIYDAFNKGINFATGEYVYFLGSDDFLFSSKTISTVAKILNCHKVDVYSGGVYVIDEIKKTEFYAGNSFACNRKTFKGNKMIPHQGMIVKTEILKKHHFDCRYKIAADYKLFLQLYMYYNYEFKFSNLPIAYYSQMGISGNNIQLLINEQRKIQREFGIISEGVDNFFSVMKKHGKKKLLNLGIFKWFMSIYKAKELNIKKHRCNNSYCRICNM